MYLLFNDAALLAALPREAIAKIYAEKIETVNLYNLRLLIEIEDTSSFVQAIRNRTDNFAKALLVQSGTRNKTTIRLHHYVILTSSVEDGEREMRPGV